MTATATPTEARAEAQNGFWAAKPIDGRAFGAAVLINLLWVNASEVFRYFVLIMPMMRAAFPETAGVAPMDWGVFLIWGLWDAVLVLAITGFVWLFLDRFGAGLSQAIAAASLFWLAVFGILWVGIFNMGLAPWPVLAVALPLAWLEMAVAALIVRWRFRPS